MEWHESTPNGAGNHVAATCYGEIGALQFGKDIACDKSIVEVLETIFLHVA